MEDKQQSIVNQYMPIRRMIAALIQDYVFSLFSYQIPVVFLLFYKLWL